MTRKGKKPRRKMRKGGGSWKGSSFERRIAKQLSLWFTNKADGTQLIRSVMSGGWRRGNRTSSRQQGDLAANGSEGEKFRAHFVVECKHRYEINLWDYWTRTPSDGNFMGWWIELATIPSVVNKIHMPLLVFRPNRRPSMLALPLPLLRILPLHGCPQIHIPEYGCGIVELKHFLTTTAVEVYAAYNTLEEYRKAFPSV